MKIDADIIPKLRTVINQKLSYKELCEQTGLSIKSGNSKIAQLRDLDMYCQIDRIEGTTKYIISEVYDEAVLRELNGNDKYQAVFEASMCQMFLDNGDNPLYVSYMDMLKGFNEVNYNFSLLCNSSNIKYLDDSYSAFPQIGQSAYKILKEWTRDRIERMNARGVALKRDGFRLYAHIGKATVIHNVQMESEEEKICQQIWNIAVNRIMPEEWNGGWVKLETWEKFEREVRKLTIEFFQGQYDDLKKIIILSPPKQEYVKEMLKNLYNKNPDLKAINEEAGRKVLESRSKGLIAQKQQDKENFVKIAMKENPEIDIRKTLYNIKENKEKTEEN